MFCTDSRQGTAAWTGFFHSAFARAGGLSLGCYIRYAKRENQSSSGSVGGVLSFRKKAAPRGDAMC